MTADMAVLLVTWMGTCFGAGTRSCCSSSDPGLELPIDMPLFHSTGEGGPAKRDKKYFTPGRGHGVPQSGTKSGTKLLESNASEATEGQTTCRTGRIRLATGCGVAAKRWISPRRRSPSGSAARVSPSERSRPTSVAHRGGSLNGSPRRSPYPRRSGAISSMRHVRCTPRTVCDWTPCRSAPTRAPLRPLIDPFPARFGNRRHERYHTIRRPK